ncbi:MAG TPA: enoyl-CoA hydratase-related protein, partial [Solirubrobacteraceae bacterium]|nr:enoyl-CoA hydratase-related protein [Solirubrobacteraceae bacterium]
MDGDPLVIDRPRDGVVRLRLNRPARRNALDAGTVEALHEAVAGLDDARAAVLASADPPVFCAGADLDLDDAERALVSDRLYALY